MAAAIAFGIFLRFENLGGKAFWEDESYTALHATGHFDHGDLRPLFNGQIHSAGRLHALQSLSPKRGLTATVKALASEDSDQGLFYYILERAAITIFGTSIVAYRLAGAFFGVLAIGAAWLLADRLFGSPRLSGLFAAIVALSPFEVLYAHEARGYTLTALLVLLSSYLFLGAVKQRTVLSWILYAAAMTLGLYTSGLLVLVAFSHMLYAAIVNRNERRVLIGLLLALAASALLYVPWFIVVAKNRALVGVQLSWGASAYPLRLMVEKWLFNASAQFFDLEWLSLRFALVGALLLLLAAAAVVYLVRTALPSQWWFVILLGGITAGVLVGRDLAEHAHWSTIARYLIPTWLALQLAAAYALSRWWSLSRAAGIVLVAFVLGAEGVSSAVNTRADSWYNNQLGAAIPSLARAIDSVRNPLVVGEKGWAFYLTLSDYLRPDVHLQLFAHAKGARITTAGYTVIVPTPTRELAAALARQGFALRQMYTYRETSNPYATFHKALHVGKAAKAEHNASFPDQLYTIVRKS